MTNPARAEARLARVEEVRARVQAAFERWREL
jgi:hypothetical protein